MAPLAQALLAAIEDIPLRPAGHEREARRASASGAPSGAGDRSERGGAFRCDWSNEIVSHVVELKNVEPSPALAALPVDFQQEVHAANLALSALGARLMPGGMHPWMDPRRETTLWTATDAEIYAQYDRLFDCRRHGWANLQSMHINLPFAGDEQFARLGDAVRLVLPLLPALAASSPFADSRPTGWRDYRLAVYATNSSRFPSITGNVIPEIVRSRAEYERNVLRPMYDDIAAADPCGILRHDWLNSRGAIARFDRSAIEIRLADAQECPRADIAIAQAVCSVARALFEERKSPAAAQSQVDGERLATMLTRTMRDGEDAAIDDGEYLAALGLAPRAMRAGAVWRELLCDVDPSLRGNWEETVSFILNHGTLATRILRAAGEAPDRPRLRDVYEELCDCLQHGRLFA